MSFFGMFSGLFGGKKNSKKKGPPLPVINLEKRFDLIARTGQGSMSTVWRARDKSLGRVVCLKLLNKEKTAKFEARFLGIDKPSEGTICMSLKHKNIVQTFETGLTTDGQPYLVMDLIDGMGLNFLIETRSPQLEGNRISILSQIADALEYLHRIGYIHRDVCPRNIMVTKEGQVKLIDFGLTVPNRPEFCRPGNRTGTTSILAPEIIRRTSTDARVDLFALGVTAFEVFTFDLPWDKTNSEQTLLAHINSPGKNPLESNPKLDPETVSFLVKAIQRNPAERFQTSTAFREGLEQLPPQ